MIKKEHVYRMKNKKLEEIIVGIVVFGFLVFTSFSAKEYLVTLLFVLLFAFCILALMGFFYDEIKITDTQLIVTRYFRKKEIIWKDISYLETKMTGFLLSDTNSDVQIFISAGIINLWEFVKILKEQRSDLLQPTKTNFHESPTIAIAIGSAGLFIIYSSVTSILADHANFIQKLLMLIIGLGFILVIVFFLKQLSFVEDKLIVKTLARTRTIQLEGIDFGSISNTGLLIISKDRYSVSVGNLIEGMPSFMIAFQYWLRSNSKKYHETIGEIS